MGKRRKQRGTAGLVVEAVVAVVSAIALTTTAYYRWATGLQNTKGRTVAYAAPVGVLALLFAFGSCAPQEPEVISRRDEIERRETVVEELEAVEPDPVEEWEIADVEPESVEEPVAEADVEPEPQYFVEDVEPEPYVAPEPVDDGIGFVSGTCGELKARGLGPFYPGDANYTNRRDRDNDGVACE